MVLPRPAEILTICNGKRHTETYTDGQGHFSFEFTDEVPMLNGGLVDADTSARREPKQGRPA